MNIALPITIGSTIPSAGAIMGTIGTDNLLKSVSTGCGVVFGKPTDHLFHEHQSWMQHIISQVKDVAHRALNTVSSFFNFGGDIGVAMSAKDIASMSAAMHVPIMSDMRFRNMLEENRIHGFGIKPEMLPEEDDIGRLIHNGRATVEKDKDTMLIWDQRSDDPDYSYQQLSDIEDTRDYIWDSFLNEYIGSSKQVENDPTHPDKFNIHSVVEANMQ